MLALVVDDSRAVRMILRGMLREAGYETIEAGHGGEALAILADRPEATLALVDWNMPIMDGLAFVRAVRARAEFHALRILMVTTETEPAQVAAALTAGADEYLMKPFAKEALFAKLSLMDCLAEREV